MIGIGIVICFACVAIRSRSPEFALTVSIAGGLLILLSVFEQVEQIMAYFDGVIRQFQVPSEGVVILLKCLGISYVAKIAGDTCVDCGQNSTATKIEFAAKVSMLAVSLPLFEQLLSVTAIFQE